MSDSTRIASRIASLATRVARGPNYKTYVERKKKEGKPPMSKDEWEVKILGKPKDEDKSKGKAPTQKVDMPPKGKLFHDREKNLPTVAKQKVKSKGELYTQAKEAHTQQLKWLNQGQGLDKAIGAHVVRGDTVKDIGKAINDGLDRPGPVVIIGPMKGEGRASEKVEADYGGDWSQLNDVVRASVAVDDFESIEQVMTELRKSGLKLAKPPSDRFTNPTSAGYRDLKMNVEFPNGHIGELQLHVKSVLRAKDAGHELYEKVRGIEASAKKEGRTDLTDEEQKIVDDANAAMKKLYDDAWAEAKGKSKKSSDKLSSLAVSLRVAAAKYFDMDGLPATLDRGKFPTKKGLDKDGKVKDITVYELEKFFTEATPVSKRVYDKMVRDLESK